MMQEIENKTDECYKEQTVTEIFPNEESSSSDLNLDGTSENNVDIPSKDNSEQDVRSENYVPDTNDDSNSEFEPITVKEIVSRTKRKRLAVINSDSENEDQEVVSEQQSVVAATYTTNSKGELILETEGSSIKKVNCGNILNIISEHIIVE